MNGLHFYLGLLRSEDIILGIRCYIRTHTMLNSPFHEDYKFTSGGGELCLFAARVALLHVVPPKHRLGACGFQGLSVAGSYYLWMI